MDINGPSRPAADRRMRSNQSVGGFLSDAPPDDSIDVLKTLSFTNELAPSDGDRRRFGEYEILEEIARGGMGVVYKARQLNLGRLVALKVMLSGSHASVTEIERFHNEAEAAAALKHPNIVPIFEIGESSGFQYFSMALVNGSSLWARVRERPLTARKAACYLATAAEAIEYAHEAGILHRDIKPSNILLDEFDQIHVTDFGLARVEHRDSSITNTGQVLGTPGFMSPEQAKGSKDITSESDVYGLGATLYAVLTGRPPFHADNPVDTLRQVIANEPVAPRLLNPAVPRDLENICLKCLQKDRQHRYATAKALAEDLQHFLDGRPVHARPVATSVRLWRWCLRNRIATGLILAVVIGITATTSQWRRAITEVHRGKILNQQKQEFLQSAEEALDAILRVTSHPTLHRPETRDLRNDLLSEVRNVYTDLSKADGDSPQVSLARGRAYNRLGTIAVQMGDTHHANNYVHLAISLLEPLAKMSPDDIGYKRELANAYSLKGRCAMAYGDSCGAVAYFSDSIDLLGVVSRVGPSESVTLELTEAQVNLSAILSFAHNSRAAIPFARKTIKVIEQSPMREDPRWRKNLAIAYNNLGESHRKLNQMVDAKTAYDACVAVCSGDSVFESVVRSNARVGLASIELSQGSTTVAERQLRKELATLSNFATEYDSYDFQYAKLFAAAELWRHLSRTGRVSEAEALMSRTISELQPQLRSLPYRMMIDVRWRQDLAKLRFQAGDIRKAIGELEDIEVLFSTDIANALGETRVLQTEFDYPNRGSDVILSHIFQEILFGAIRMDMLHRMYVDAGETDKAQDARRAAESRWEFVRLTDPADLRTRDDQREIELMYAAWAMRIAAAPAGQDDAPVNRRSIDDLQVMLEQTLRKADNTFEHEELLADALAALAKFAFESGDTSKALWSLEREAEVRRGILDRFPNHLICRQLLAKCHVFQGRLLAVSGNPLHAHSAFEDAIALDKDLASAGLCLAFLMATEPPGGDEQRSKSVDLAKQVAATFDKTSWQACMVLGHALASCARYDEAVNEVRKAIDIAPNDRVPDLEQQANAYARRELIEVDFWGKGFPTD